MSKTTPTSHNTSSLKIKTFLQFPQWESHIRKKTPTMNMYKFALYVHNPKLSLHVLQWASSTRMSSFYQDRCAEPCPSSTCHYWAYAVVSTILINFAQRDKSWGWVDDTSMSLHLISSMVHSWKGKGVLPTLLQPYSCASKWCHGFPVTSWKQGPWFTLGEENGSLILALMLALPGKGTWRQMQIT